MRLPSMSVREVVQTTLMAKPKAEAVPLSKVVRDVRTRTETYQTDEELKDHIVMTATDLGYAVEFD